MLQSPHVGIWVGGINVFWRDFFVNAIFQFDVFLVPCSHKLRLVKTYYMMPLTS